MGKIGFNKQNGLNDIRTQVLSSALKSANYINKNSLDCPGYGPQPFASFIGRFSRLGNNLLYSFNSKSRIGSVISASSCASAIDLNLGLYTIGLGKKFLTLSEKGGKWLLDKQEEEGFWHFKKFEGKGNRIQTVDSSHGAISLLGLFRITGNKKYLLSALNFSDYIYNNGRAEYDNGKIYYRYYLDGEYADLRVTNISCLLISLFTESYKATKETKYLSWASELIPFIEKMSLASGELRYSSIRKQYQGPQYNAFQLIFLSNYYSITKDTKIKKIMEGIKNYICNSVNGNGSIDYGNIGWGYNAKGRLVYYHSFAVSKALRVFDQLFDKNHNLEIYKTTMFGLTHQKLDGSYPFGKNALFGVIDDVVPYPRYIGYCANLSLSVWFDTKWYNFASSPKTNI